MLHLLTDAEVFAPEPLGRRHVLVGGGEILAATADRPRLGGVDVETVDLKGARLIPGLIDAHVHVTGGGGEAGPETAAPAPPLTAYTRAGVTSVVGLLGTDDSTRSTAGLLRQVRALRREGISAWAWTGGYHLPPTTLTGSVRGDLAHIAEIIGFGELALSDHRSSQPTVTEVARVAADCHVGGLMTGKAGVLHCHLGDGPRGLAMLREILQTTEIPPRTLHPTHVNRRRALWDEALEFARLGATVDVTAFPPEHATADEVDAAEAVRAFAATDLPADRLTVSSDGGGCLPHFDAQGELLRMDFATSGAMADLLARLLASGMPEAVALAPMTHNPAALLRLHRKGRIAPGLDADLVVLGDDHRPRDVMARGRWHVREGETVVRGTFER
ncbi:MAG: beta-aspartyl-peptidase [Bacteroidota bacterium]